LSVSEGSITLEQKFERGGDVMSVPTAGSALVLFARARSALAEAATAQDAGDRFCLAHLAALRAAAALLALRGRPAASRRRLMSAWVLVESVAPEFAEWAAYFAAGASSRAAIEAGAVAAVSDRAADDQLRAADEFLRLVEGRCGVLPVALAG
jgi:hypothetical protein